jgi:hypothetical protein
VNWRFVPKGDSRECLQKQSSDHLFSAYPKENLTFVDNTNYYYAFNYAFIVPSLHSTPRSLKMTISSVSSNIISPAINNSQNVPQSNSKEVRGEKENDGDRDDGASSKVTAPTPTVNTSGQTTGAIINVKA